jgi:hypothetical protein
MPVPDVAERACCLSGKVQFCPGPGRAHHRNRRVNRAEAEIIFKTQNLFIAACFPQGYLQRAAGALTEHDMKRGARNAYDPRPIFRPHADSPGCGANVSHISTRGPGVWSRCAYGRHRLGDACVDIPPRLWITSIAKRSIVTSPGAPPLWQRPQQLHEHVARASREPTKMALG